MFPSLVLGVFLSLFSSVLAFTPSNNNVGRIRTRLYADATDVTVDPKEAVKVFGRLAEKYIMLDASGGMCCYSACSGKFHPFTLFFLKKFERHAQCSLLCPYE